MSKELRILYVEDDETEIRDLQRLLNGTEINGYTLKIDGELSFEAAHSRAEDYGLVILDLMNGSSYDGESVFNHIQSSFFVPVIFYSGLTKDVESLKSQVVGVAKKKCWN